MPVLVKDYVWKESSNIMLVKVPLRGLNRFQPDIFTSEFYVKAHFKPFLFEAFLFDKIDIERSKCVIEDEQIIFELVKVDDKEWGALEKELSKAEKLRVKQEAIAEIQAITAKKREEKALKKAELDRHAVHMSMEIDTAQHKIIESRRNEEKEKAMNSLEDWRQNQTKDNNIQNRGENQGKVVQSTKERNSPKTPQKQYQRQRIVQSEFVNQKKKELEGRVIPNIRGVTEIEIKFTPRTFPTPLRESTAAEEQVWLSNVTAARRATGFVSEDLRPEEQDPQWCKEKGDEFFKNGNFLGAISAYTHGITLSDKLPSLYANRAATHFALGNFNKCVNDCSDALDLFKPACEANRVSRARCIARRAAGLARLGRLHKAIDEMKAAAKLLPDDDGLKKDIYDMERAWEQDPDSD